MISWVRFLKSSESGQATVEYALVTTLIVIVIVGLSRVYLHFSDGGVVEKAAKSAPYSVTDIGGLTKDVLVH